MESDPAHRRQMLGILHGILRAHPEGIKEYDLLLILKEKGLPLFKDLEFADPLVLFRTHFMLFHLLYHLRDRLDMAKKGIVEIHALKIVLLPWQSNSRGLPQVRDRMGEYYRDLAQIEGTGRPEINAMIEQFWQDYIAYQFRPESFSVLGLDQKATRAEIKQRYRSLAKQHHPDRGGDAAEFQRIRDAAQTLLR